MPSTTSAARVLNAEDRTNKLIARVEALRRLRNALMSKKALLSEAMKEYESAEAEYNTATMEAAIAIVDEKS